MKKKWITRKAIYLIALLLLTSYLLYDYQLETASWQQVRDQYQQQFRDGDYDGAIETAQQAIILAEEKLGSMHPDLANMLYDLGSIFYASGKAEKAQMLLEKAVSIRKFYEDTDPILIAEALDSLGSVNYSLGNVEEAEKMYLEAIQLREDKFGPESVELLNPLYNLASLYAFYGQKEKANNLYKRTLAISQDTFGTDSLKYSEAIDRYAFHLYHMKDNEIAEPLFLESLQIKEKLAFDRVKTIALAYNNLAENFQVQDKTSEAQNAYEKAIELLQAEEPPYDQETLVVFENAKRFFKGVNDLKVVQFLQKKIDASKPSPTT